LIEHSPQNAMTDAGEIARFRDRCSAYMGALLDELSTIGDRDSASGRWEIWMDAGQAAALDADGDAG
jgi:hypothetical protein